MIIYTEQRYFDTTATFREMLQWQRRIIGRWTNLQFLSRRREAYFHLATVPFAYYINTFSCFPLSLMFVIYEN